MTMSHPRQFKEIGPDGLPYDIKGKVIENCIESVPDGGRFITSHTCGKKLKGDTEFPWLCGLHVSVIHRRRSKGQQHNELRTQRSLELETANTELEQLNTRLGITSTLRTLFPTKGPDAFVSRPTRDAVVPVEKLRELADRLDELTEALEAWQRADRNGVLG